MLIIPIEITAIIVAVIPHTINYVSWAVSKLSSDSPAPTKTTADDLGNIPTKVPMINDLSGTRAAAIRKLVNAKASLVKA